MEKKIIELFRYRKLFDLLSEGYYDEESSLYRALYTLQVRIYELDTYLETNWRTSKKSLNKYWKAIENSLLEIGVAKSQLNDFLSFIHKYESHELAMRKGKMPSTYSIEYYYFYKSCDIKLIRQIIYDFIPGLKKHYSLSDWRQFDLIGEINDDIEDVYEDQNIINGNYFQALLKTEGKEICLKRFSDFLDKQVIKAELRYEKKGTKSQKQLLRWTKNYYRETKKLLKSRIKEIDLERLDLRRA